MKAAISRKLNWSWNLDVYSSNLAIDSVPFFKTPTTIFEFFKAESIAAHTIMHIYGRTPAMTHPVIQRNGNSTSKQYTHTDAFRPMFMAKVRILARSSVATSRRLLQCRIATVINPTGTARYSTFQSICCVTA